MAFLLYIYIYLGVFQRLHVKNKTVVDGAISDLRVKGQDSATSNGASGVVAERAVCGQVARAMAEFRVI